MCCVSEEAAASCTIRHRAKIRLCESGKSGSIFWASQTSKERVSETFVPVSPRGTMTDYHAEGVKLLAYVPAPCLTSNFTMSPPATAAPETASKIFFLPTLERAQKLGTPVQRTVAGAFVLTRGVPVTRARAHRKRRARRSA